MNKQQILEALRMMPPVAAETSRYFADLLVAAADRHLDESDLNHMAAIALMKAGIEAAEPMPPDPAELAAIAEQYSEPICELAILMASHVLGKRKVSWAKAGAGPAIIAALAVLGA